MATSRPELLFYVRLQQLRDQVLYLGGFHSGHDPDVTENRRVDRNVKDRDFLRLLVCVHMGSMVSILSFRVKTNKLGVELFSERTESTESEIQVGNFKGWAIVEMMGHRREVGFVTTESFGAAVLFRVDTPERPERDYVLEKPEHAQVAANMPHRYCPAGTKVRRRRTPARSVLVAPGSLYAMNPCSERAALAALETFQPRPLFILELPDDPRRAIAAATGHQTSCQSLLCVRCGSPYDSTGSCSRRVSGPCQGGNGEALPCNCKPGAQAPDDDGAEEVLSVLSPADSPDDFDEEEDDDQPM